MDQALNKAPKDKNQDEAADQRRDELARRVLKMPPQPKSAKPTTKEAKPAK
jgi:hypothetical protein